MRKLLLTFFLLTSVFIFFIYTLSFFLEPLPLERYTTTSKVILDDNNDYLNQYLTPKGYWRLTTHSQDLQKLHLKGLLAYEDKRFFSHPGVDPVALIRAAGQWFFYGKPISGASTITMQVVRLLGYQRRDLIGKMVQISLALKLERDHSKQQILSMYLTLTPFGGNVEGIRAAAFAYFKKDPVQLDLSEIALLIGIPQSPEARRLDRISQENLKKTKDHILARLYKANVITKRQFELAQLDQVKTKKHKLPNIAPHLGIRLLSQYPSKQTINTTINVALQNHVARIASDTLTQLRDGTDIAILIVRNKDRAVRAYLGGTDYFDPTNPNYNDLARAQRSPGSTLKPIIYGMAFEEIIVHPETLIVDAHHHFSGYAPVNFDRTFLGEITVRESLIKSLNTTAVLLLNEIGVSRFLSRLRSSGVPLNIRQPDTDAGLSVGLGGGGISLVNLTRLYVAIANKGESRELNYIKEQSQVQSSRLLTQESAWSLVDILADSIPPKSSSMLNNYGALRRVAFKTGTSYGFRDAWTIGFDSQHTVAVWIGRSDNRPNPGYSGLNAAAPVLFQLFDLLPFNKQDVADKTSADMFLSRNTDLPKRLKRFYPAQSLIKEHGSMPLQIIYPPNDIELEMAEDELSKTVNMLVRGGEKPYFWFVNGLSIAEASYQSQISWHTEQRGQHNIQVIDSGGSQKSVSIWVE